MINQTPEPTAQESAIAWEAHAHLLEQRIAVLEAPPVIPPRWYQSPRIVGVIGELSAFLTILAALPYELGDAATILSPQIKIYVASTGVFATLALRLWKRYLEPKPTVVAPTA